MKVLVVEDDAEIASVLQEGLEGAGYQPDIVANGLDGFELATTRPYALILLDVMLPEMTGIEICERLRLARIRTPILMLTARDAVPDRVRGLEAGADDYLPKPFDFSELLARMHALLRRDQIHKSKVIQIDDLEIDTSLRSVVRANREINLTRREYDLLVALASSEGKVFTREMIQERVWMDDQSYSNTVDVHVRLLRQKLDSDHETKLIRTVHGVGYTLRGSRPPQ